MTNINPTFIDRSNIVGEWLLDGHARDTAGTNNGTATNITWVSADRGYVEEVGSFNGSNSDFNTPYDLSSGNAINIWIYDEGDEYSFHYIYDNDSSSSSRSLIFFKRSTTTLEIYAGGTRIIDDDGTILNAIPLNKWTMITIYQESGDNEVYINRELISTSTTTFSGTSSNITLGKRYSNADYFEGKMGLFRILNIKPTQELLDALYLEGLRKLGPTNRANLSQGFPFYSLPNLEDGKILEISKAVSGGTYYDQTGNGNNGTPTNVADSTVGKYNAMTFNGSSSYINMGDVSSLEFAGGDFSFSCHARWDSSPTAGTHIVDKNGYLGNGYRVFTGGSGTIRLNVNSVNVDSGFIPEVGRIYKIFVTHENLGNSKIYIDGREIVSVNTNTSLRANTSNLEIGRRNAGISYFPGIIGNLKFYNNVYSDTEIQQDYYSSKII